MPLASSGIRPALSRTTNRNLFTGNQVPRRAFHWHFPSPPPLPPPVPPVASAPSSTAQRLARTTRKLISRFLQHAATPGVFYAPTTGISHQASAYALHGAARAPTIQQGLSLPVRHALSKPFGALHLPRPPTIPRGVTQVGLGNARAFHSGRPIFQSLADNVPIAARALYEADINTRKRTLHSEAKVVSNRAQVKGSRKGKGPRAKENTQYKATGRHISEPKELDTYLPIATVASVTTHMLIPLTPSPAGRTPLMPNGSVLADHLDALSALERMHESHGLHATRVSSLFGRLDSARVWEDPTVRCSAQAHGTPGGVCTVIEVVFEGWDERQVRSVLGEAGRGWCEIHETRTSLADSILDDHPDTTSLTRDAALHEELDQWFEGHHQPHSPRPSKPRVEVDPALTLVLPRLDFAATVADAHDIVSFHSSEEWDSASEFSIEGIEDSMTYDMVPAVIPRSSAIVFSSSFTERLEARG